ncbi:MAG TPA: nuclear transport factor 2 family protein [Chthoniobacterales bacterium]
MFEDDEWSGATCAILKALLTLATLALLWWWWEDRPSPIAPWRAPAKALRDYIDAARRKDCAAVLASLSKRSLELARERTPAGRSFLERSFCEYTPATAKLQEFETNRIRIERVSGNTALVSASYTYDRFFGFFGRGRSRYTYTLAREDGIWRIDYTESLDPESRSNQNRRAMFLVQQVYTALHDHVRSTGKFTDNTEAIQAQLPGYKFPEIRPGIADANAPPDVPHVALAPAHACISIKSASGTLVMVKAAPAPPQSTYQYGEIPSVCDDQPLARPYHGSTSGIR